MHALVCRKPTPRISLARHRKGRFRGASVDSEEIAIVRREVSTSRLLPIWDKLSRLLPLSVIRDEGGPCRIDVELNRSYCSRADDGVGEARRSLTRRSQVDEIPVRINSYR